jgi:hypothetical protein
MEFYQQAFPITKEELQPGDCMLNAGDHVCLFGGWTDENQTHCIYEVEGEERNEKGEGRLEDRGWDKGWLLYAECW